ncbi:MAG: helix-turn-helix domain-containing protein [Flectobacillus sp.]|uniref:helix-turn-helix domain-containing protein n=1 Tax=Flectobacillus sp. TaxID=50419 RepID=UPI003B9BAE07
MKFQKIIFSTIYLLLLGPWLYAQLRIEVHIPAQDRSRNIPIFIACSFNNWSPGDPNFRLEAISADTYAIELPQAPSYFEYKFTQGYWTQVEGDSQGHSRPNRVYDRLKEQNPQLLSLQIEGWEARPTYRFYIKSLPKNTPQDASIYIAGNFNNWDPGNESYKLQKQFDGTYRVTVSTELEKLEYKFTRGNWETVEGQENGKACPNRTLYRKSDFRLEEIPVDIKGWEDLTGTFNFYSIYDLLILFSAFQCILLLVAIPTMQDYNRKANQWLLLSIAFTAIVLIMKTLTGYRVVAEQYSRLLLIPDFALFLYAPLFYFYLQKLLFKTPQMPVKWWLHFVLPILQILVYMPFMLLSSKELLIKLLNKEQDLHLVSVIAGTISWFVNIFYWFINWKSIEGYNKQYPNQASNEQNTDYLHTVLILQAICLLLWAFTGLLVFGQRFFEWDTVLLADKSIDIIWLAFSAIPYFLGYFAIHQPEIFKIVKTSITQVNILPNKASNDTPSILSKLPEISPEIIPQTEETPVQDIEKDANHEQLIASWKEKIDEFMNSEKPYTNVGLTLNELAGMLKITPHLLSKVINEAYQKNFFDFINSYRIEEFKIRFEDPRNRQFTMLAIAFDVGFNSKTAFNRAFKKMTSQSPREYFFDSRVEE